MTEIKAPQGLLADAVRAREDRRFSESLQLLTEALAAGEAAATVYFQMGNTYADAGQWNDAAKAYLMALDIDPAHYKAKHNLGVAYRRLGRVTDSVRCLRAAAKLQTGTAGAAGEPPPQIRHSRWTQLIALALALLLAGWFLSRRG